MGAYDWSKDNWVEEEQLLALRAAYEFAEYTFTLTDKDKFFPHKYKMIVDAIRNHAMTIPTLINLAKWNTKERKKYGQQAINRIDDALFKMKLLYKIDSNLGSKAVDKWKKLACDVRYITYAWINSKK